MFCPQLELGAKSIDAVSGYGPYAFGVIATIVLLTAAATLWAKVIAPRQQALADARLKAAEEFTKATENIKSTAQSQANLAAELSRTAFVQAEQSKHIRDLSDDLLKAKRA